MLDDYITAVKVKLLTSPVILSFIIVQEKVIGNQGYLRARLTLTNGDFCEIVEFFTVKNQAHVTESYRYQWMDANKQELRKRWDNVEHFPNLSNFPHHVHILEETNVHPSECRNILEIIDYLEKFAGVASD